MANEVSNQCVSVGFCARKFARRAWKKVVKLERRGGS